ncbi:MAG: ligase-associated DNA damage response DEXH box helicase [Methyloligellaceae bacterium]
MELSSARNKQNAKRYIHTLYISPLKALAVDVARNLEQPIADMNLSIRTETRTGDTPSRKRLRQKQAPPDILLTTPEQVALLLADEAARQYFSELKYIILDELHALAQSKRGDLLSLGLARLRNYAPDVKLIGLSATIAWPFELAAYLVPQGGKPDRTAISTVKIATTNVQPDIQILKSGERLPWSGHSARYAYQEILEQIRKHRMVLVFVNTRSQAEMIFHQLWHMNEDNLAIALHHGSLDVQKRRRIERAMTEGLLRAIVCTSTLDLGIDWGDVDLVINVGAPKGASRLSQRIGRANHRIDEPSKAVLIPANRFEVLECEAAREAAAAGAQDTPRIREGALDVLAQHVLGMACAEPFDKKSLFEEIKSAYPYRNLPEQQFDEVIDFVATGGYALRSYDKFAKLRQSKEGQYRVANVRIARQYRLNVGTIVEAPMIRIRLLRRSPASRSGHVSVPLQGGAVLGEVEEWFLEQMVTGDTFLFAGEILRFEAIRENFAYVTRSRSAEPKVPSYQGGKFPLSTYLAARVRHMLATPSEWKRLPPSVASWLRIQKQNSVIPSANEMLVETFPKANKHYLVCYPFEGRLAHQSLGMLLTRRLERLHAYPMGFVANDYALAIWGLKDLNLMIERSDLDLDKLFDEDMLGDDLDAWLAESSLMKRTFRTCAVISGLIERKYPGQEKSGRQITFSTDLIYDVLRTHQPDHILLQACWADASGGLLDLGRVSEFLARIRGSIRHQSLERISPLAVPIMLEIGREPIYGAANEELMKEMAAGYFEEAEGTDDTQPE